MKTSTLALIVAVLIILAGGWYWWNHMQPQATLGTPTATTTNAMPGSAYVPDNLLLGTDATSTLGTYLIASNGMTLYTFAKDSSGTSTCYGQCAATWMPYTIGSADALDNVQAGIDGDVGSIVRKDNTTQVTYKGMPLYLYSRDMKSGDTMGQNVAKAWFVVKP